MSFVLRLDNLTVLGEAIKGLSLALLFGVTVGTYSSIYIAAPVLLYFRVCSELKESEQPFERQA